MRVTGEVFRQEFQCDKVAKLSIFNLVDDAYARGRARSLVVAAHPATICRKKGSFAALYPLTRSAIDGVGYKAGKSDTPQRRLLGAAGRETRIGSPCVR